MFRLLKLIFFQVLFSQFQIYVSPIKWNLPHINHIIAMIKHICSGFEKKSSRAMFVLARTFVFWSATIPFISKYASLEPKFHEILNKVCLVKMLIEMKSPENCNFLNILSILSMGLLAINTITASVNHTKSSISSPIAYSCYRFSFILCSCCVEASLLAEEIIYRTKWTKPSSEIRIFFVFRFSVSYTHKQAPINSFKFKRN